MTLFAGWSLRKRMTLLVGVAGVSLVTLAVTSLMGIGALSGASTNLGTAKDAVADILPPPLNLMGAYLLTHELEGVSDTQRRASDLAALTAALRAYEERSAVWRRTFAQRPELIATLDEHDRTARAFIARCEKDFIPAVKAGDETRARHVRETELLPLFRANETTATRFTDQSTALQNAAVRHFDEVALRARLVSTAVAVVALLLTLVLVGTVSRTLVARLEVTKRAMQRVAEGDLTTEVDASGRDEFGEMAQAMNQLVASMRKALEGVSRASGTVARASRELAESVTTLSHGSRAQAASLEEAAASLEQITATMKHNADGAQQASTVANDSRRIAEEGGQVTGDAVKAMSEINARSREIAAIITTIDEIAFQTNLLALNAAVEAARAGEQGRGFAVVASEVRNLAQRSAKAAAEIKSLIQHSVRQIDDGTKLVNRSGDTLGGIVSSVTRLSEIVAEIAAANREQSSGIQQVNDAVGQMDRETQNSAARTEELSATAESLAYESRELQGMVAHFRLGGPGPAAQAPDKVVPAKIVTGDFGRPQVAYSVPVAVARSGGRAEAAEAGFEEL